MKKKKLLVIDSSVAVKWLNKQNEKFIEKADKILINVQVEKVELVMPELSKYEIGNALLNKKMELPEAKSSLATYYSIPIQFVTQNLEMSQETMEIAHNHGITFYDASFIVLAKKLKAYLVTDNPKHQKILKGIEAKIISLENYK